MTQDERLAFLVEAYRQETGRGEEIPVPLAAEGRRRLLRALMNVRPPRPLTPKVAAVEAAYLAERTREKGVVRPEDIPTIRTALGNGGPFADRLSLWRGDITRLAADAVVNAANEEMLGCFIPLHSCIDNAIHSAAGTALRLECARQMEALRRCRGPSYVQPTTVPLITGACALPARAVIHIVGPIVRGALTPAHEETLAACYRNVLSLCNRRGLRTVAFCCLSTGVFRFPRRRAAAIAVRTVTDWLANHSGAMDRVIFDVFTEEDEICYEKTLRTC